MGRELAPARFHLEGSPPVSSKSPPMRLAIVTDEITPDFESAVRAARGWGIEWFEIRGLASGRLPDVSRQDLDAVTRLVEREGARVSALSPGVFKVPVSAPEVARQLDETLPRTYALAQRWGARIVIVFPFRKEDLAAPEPPDAVIEALRRAAREAAQAGLRVVLENERGTWAGTGAESAALLRAAGHDNLRLNWDPGNAVAAGDTPYPDGYQAARGWVAHLHIKDERRSPTGFETVLPGDGEINWPGQFRALLQDGYDGFFTIETHFGPGLETSQAATARVRQMLHAAHLAVCPERIEGERDDG